MILDVKFEERIYGIIHDMADNEQQTVERYVYNKVLTFIKNSINTYNSLVINGVLKLEPNIIIKLDDLDNISINVDNINNDKDNNSFKTISLDLGDKAYNKLSNLIKLTMLINEKRYIPTNFKSINEFIQILIKSNIQDDLNKSDIAELDEEMKFIVKDKIINKEGIGNEKI